MHEVSEHLQAANDNRSLSSFWRPHHRRRTESELADLIARLDVDGVDDDTMIEGLFDFLMMLLLPKRDEHEWPDTVALKRYCQARRFSGRLENFGKILIGEGETADLVSPY